MIIDVTVKYLIFKRNSSVIGSVLYLDLGKYFLPYPNKLWWQKHLIVFIYFLFFSFFSFSMHLALHKGSMWYLNGCILPAFQKGNSSSYWYWQSFAVSGVFLYCCHLYPKFTFVEFEMGSSYTILVGLGLSLFWLVN